MKINFQNPGLFEYRFKRKPKNWSIEELHNLYLEVKTRSKDSQKKLTDLISVISKNIPVDHKNRHVVYFTQSKNMRQYEFEYRREYDSYSYSIGETKLDTRESRLEFILNNEKAIELGEEFRKISHIRDCNSRSMWKVKEVLFREIGEKLRKEIDVHDKRKAITIRIGEKKYIMKIDGNPDYKTFELLDECDGKIIEIY